MAFLNIYDSLSHSHLGLSLILSGLDEAPPKWEPPADCPDYSPWKKAGLVLPKDEPAPFEEKKLTYKPLPKCIRPAHLDRTLKSPTMVIKKVQTKKQLAKAAKLKPHVHVIGGARTENC